MSKDFILLEALKTFSVDQAVPWLGRIVRSYRDPISAYTPIEGQVLSSQPHEDDQYTNVRLIASKLSSTKLRADFLGLFGFSGKANSSDLRELESCSVQRLRIHNEDVILEQLLRNPEVSERLDKWGFSIMKPTFMVVGLLVADGISYQEQHSSGGGIGLQTDPEKIAGAIAGGLPLPFTLPISGESEHDVGNSMSMIAKGRRVFAVEYRVFQRKMTSVPWGPTSAENTKLRDYGPAGDRAFDPSRECYMARPARPEETQLSFINASLDELVEEDEEDYCFSFDAEESPESDDQG